MLANQFFELSKIKSQPNCVLADGVFVSFREKPCKTSKSNQ